MFEVKKTNTKRPEYFIINPENPMQVMRLTELAEVSELHTALTEFLTAQRLTEFIGSTQAQQIAQEQGYTIPITSLVNACARGTIPAANKRRGRWYMPKTNFLLWFDEWKAKQPGSPIQEEA